MDHVIGGLNLLTCFHDMFFQSEGKTYDDYVADCRSTKVCYGRAFDRFLLLVIFLFYHQNWGWFLQLGLYIQYGSYVGLENHVAV